MRRQRVIYYPARRCDRARAGDHVRRRVPARRGTQHPADNGGQGARDACAEHAGTARSAPWCGRRPTTPRSASRATAVAPSSCGAEHTMRGGRTPAPANRRGPTTARIAPSAPTAQSSTVSPSRSTSLAGNCDEITGRRTPAPAPAEWTRTLDLQRPARLNGHPSVSDADSRRLAPCMITASSRDLLDRRRSRTRGRRRRGPLRPTTTSVAASSVTRCSATEGALISQTCSRNHDAGPARPASTSAGQGPATAAARPARAMDVQLRQHHQSQPASSWNNLGDSDIPVASQQNGARGGQPHDGRSRPARLRQGWVDRGRWISA